MKCFVRFISEIDSQDIIIYSNKYFFPFLFEELHCLVVEIINNPREIKFKTQ